MVKDGKLLRLKYFVAKADVRCEYLTVRKVYS